MTTIQDIKSHYTSLEETRGFTALCAMHLPNDLQGKRVLNVGCRNGKGTQKISQMVGEQGCAVGLDWDEGHVSHAGTHIICTMKRNGYSKSNMEFVRGYPEDLVASGLDDASFDVVYCNSVVNLLYNPSIALEQFAWALASGGTLVLDTVIAEGDRDDKIVQAARILGNAVQAAPSFKDLETMLNQAGFSVRAVEILNPVEPTATDQEGKDAPVIVGAEDVAFFVATIEAIKK